MRRTFATVVVLTSALLGLNAFWPFNDHGTAARQAFAEEGSAAKASTTPTAMFVTPPRDDRYEAIVAKLKTKIDLNFQETTVREAVDYFAQLVSVPVLYNTRSLNDEGIDLDADTITYNLTGVPASTCLDVMFWNRNLSYRIWDGFIVVETESTTRNEMEVCVYNCRDLLNDAAAVNEMSIKKQKSNASQPSDPKEVEMASTESKYQTVSLTPPQALIKVLMNSVAGPWMEEDGEGGTITAFDGMLVVRNNQKAQQNVQLVLGMLRSADTMQINPQNQKTTTTTYTSEVKLDPLAPIPDPIGSKKSDLDELQLPSTPSNENLK